jgi:hypothetical protein
VTGIGVPPLAETRITAAIGSETVFVAGLQIAMNDTRFMCSRQRVGDLNGVLKGLIEWEGALGQPIGQRLALEILEDEIGCAFVFADVI